MRGLAGVSSALSGTTIPDSRKQPGHVCGAAAAGRTARATRRTHEDSCAVAHRLRHGLQMCEVAGPIVRRRGSPRWRRHGGWPIVASVTAVSSRHEAQSHLGSPGSRNTRIRHHLRAQSPVQPVAGRARTTADRPQVHGHFRRELHRRRTRSGCDRRRCGGRCRRDSRRARQCARALRESVGGVAHGMCLLLDAQRRGYVERAKEMTSVYIERNVDR